MSMAKHHIEWLKLLEVSGPFLSLPVVMRVFPHGLDKHDPELFSDLRSAFTEWEASLDDRKRGQALHHAWIRFVLEHILGFHGDTLLTDQAAPPHCRLGLGEYAEVLVPDFVVVDPPQMPEAGKARLLVQTYPHNQDLERAIPHAHWQASPCTRMMELLHASGVPLGLVSNGEAWTLVYAPVGETAGYATWRSSLWIEERLTLQAFQTLLRRERFFNCATENTLPLLLQESVQDQHEVTTQLGFQVRKAVEVLIRSLDVIDHESGRQLLKDVDEKTVYEGALTVMMRLVFLFCAEERGLLLLGDALYDQHYAVSTLREQLREDADRYGEEVLERRFDAWSRLLSTFRAVHAGVAHEAMTLPAYGGALFDPDRFPFLEGRRAGSTWKSAPAEPLAIDNRTTLHLLEALQMLQVKVPGGGPSEARRLSFRSLDIEQIGHVYEGLLDHTAKRAAADGPVVGLVSGKKGEFEVELKDLEERYCTGDKALNEFLVEKTGKTSEAIAKALTAEPDPLRRQKLLASCGNHKFLFEAVAPFLNMIRDDTFGRPLVIPGGGIYVTEGQERRATGTHYTPRSLTESIVQHTLEPLVFEGPVQGKPRESWRLKSGKEILDLKILDMAMGSGAFLVQACRWLSERLVEAWEMEAESAQDVPRAVPFAAPATGSPEEMIIPDDADERLAYSRRLICDRCLYGVDKNPMAVDMAKLSLWLITLDKARPFTFLDHALKSGDSLLGLTSVDQIEKFHFITEWHQTQDVRLISIIRDLFKRSMAKRLELESFTVNSIHDSQRKAALLEETREIMGMVAILADMLTGIAVAHADGESGKRGGLLSKEFDKKRDQVWSALEARYQRLDVESAKDAIEALVPDAQALLDVDLPLKSASRRPFHWPLEFPEVFVNEDQTRRGFSAIVGNPPFMGGQKITGGLGTAYRNYLIDVVAGGRKGSADLCAYFFLQAAKLEKNGGITGLLATNTIAQGDTREVGLDQLTEKGFSIPRAVPSRKWPGTANLEVAHVWLRKGPWIRPYILNDIEVLRISPLLQVPGHVLGMPFTLRLNQKRSFQGPIVLGKGFLVSLDEADKLLNDGPRNKDVLFPYLNGDDFNSNADQGFSRYVINFRSWPLRRASIVEWRQLNNNRQPSSSRVSVVQPDYDGPVAADYPQLLKIVEQRAKPERDNASNMNARKFWWRFLGTRPELEEAIGNMKEVIVGVRHTKHWSVCRFKPQWVFSDALIIFPLSPSKYFSFLQSNLHEAWVRRYSGSLETRLRYSPTDCFENFPFPTNLDDLDVLSDTYDKNRQSIMLSRQEGLTKTYNRFHNPAEDAEDIVKLRRLHVEMDYAVSAAYGWADLDLDHGFHETKQGTRYTISEPARMEVLDRLLALNHERYEEEMKKGLHDSGKKTKQKTASKRKVDGRELSLKF